MQGGMQKFTQASMQAVMQACMDTGLKQVYRYEGRCTGSIHASMQVDMKEVGG